MMHVSQPRSVYSAKHAYQDLATEHNRDGTLQAVAWKLLRRRTINVERQDQAHGAHYGPLGANECEQNLSSRIL
jgi:hypothetical protein